jgi:hypothetical protein
MSDQGNAARPEDARRLSLVAARAPGSREHAGTRLVIKPECLPDEILRRIIDESIVPALVEKYLSEKSRSSNSQGAEA